VEKVAIWLFFQALFIESLSGERLLASPPSLVSSKHPALSTACPFQFLAYSVFFCGARGRLSRRLGWFIPGVAVGVACAAYFAHLLVCVSQAGLALASGGTGALLFFQCNVVWKSFVWAGGLGCQTFASFGGFFSTSVTPASQQDF
jgi:hypothetical protein